MTDRPEQGGVLNRFLEETFSILEGSLRNFRPELRVDEVGLVTFSAQGIARVKGLQTTRAGEILEFPGQIQGLAFNVDEHETGVVLLQHGEKLEAGDEVRRTGRVLEVPVGEALLGRVVDPLARPLDGGGPIRTRILRPVEQPAPQILDRLPVTVPLQTGIKAVDALVPIGRGQRELILGDRQTGKTAIALDAMINQKDRGVLCIYCGVGKRGSALAGVVAELGKRGALDYSIVVGVTEEDPPGLQFVAPFTAMTMAEFFMERGRDVLLVLDDLTRHARAYRELSLLLERPPGREAYPGDIFYLHSRLLERSTHLKEEKGGGSVTALPIIETEAQNISAYIPTNLISITDGQIYLSPELFQKGILPAIDVGQSVSRVGGKTQLPVYRAVAADLRLAYSQFTELESFARFGTRLDPDTKKNLERGRRVREILKQPQYWPLTVAEQITALLAANEGLLDPLPAEEIAAVEKRMQEAVQRELPNLNNRLELREPFGEEDREALLRVIRESLGIDR